MKYNAGSKTAAILTVDELSMVTMAKSAKYTVSGTCSTDGVDDVRIEATDGTVSSPSVLTSCINGVWTTSLDIRELADGAENIRVNAGFVETDITAYAISSKDTLVTISIDKLPVVDQKNNLIYKVSGTCESDGEDLVTIDANDKKSSIPTVRADCTAGTWSGQLDMSDLNSGNDHITVTAAHTDAAGNSDSASLLTSKKTFPPVFADLSAQAYTVGVQISKLKFANTGGVATSCQSKPALPSGLVVAVSGNTCEISGTPTVAVAQKTYTVSGTAADSSQDSANVKIKVTAAKPPILANLGSLVLTKGVAAAAFTFVNTGDPAVSCSSIPALPAGLTVAVTGSTCQITGTPALASVFVNYTITGTSADSSTDTATVGIKVNTPPISATSIVTATEDIQYVFTAGNFNFSDADGDVFTSVRITTLETVGALKLSGADVTLNQIVTKATIDAGNLTFINIAAGNGLAYDSFAFRVNDGVAESNNSYTMTINVLGDTDAPVASTFTRKVGQAITVASAPVDFTLTFNQAINPATLTAGDFSNQGTATVTAWSVADTGDQTTFTISATTVTADGTIAPRLAAAGAADMAGNTNTALKDSTDTITIDTTGPDVSTFVKNSGQNAVTNSTNVEFKVTFNEEINPASFTAGDLSNAGTATVTSWSIAVDTVNTVFIVSATGVSVDGTVTPRIADASLTDVLGNTNSGSKTASASVTFDTDNPVASTFTKKVGQANIVAAAPVDFTLTFDQAINPASLAAGDFSNQGTATVTVWSVTDSGDQTTFTISATTVTSDGTIIPRLAAAGASDLATNTNATLKDSTDTITFDATGPDVTSFVKNFGQNTNTNATNVEFKVIFNQEINPASFTIGDLSNSGTALITGWSISVDTANTIFIVSATTVTLDGTIVPRIADGSVADPQTNTNAGAKTASESVTFDTVAPVASTFTKKVGQANSDAAAPVEFTLTFNQAINPASLVGGDFSNQGSATVSAWSVADTGDQTIFTISATTVTADGTIIPRLAAAGAADLAGNTNAALKDSTDTITFDTAGPGVTSFIKNTGQSATTNTTNVEFKVIFDQEINAASFTNADLSNAGTATVTSWSIAVDTANTIFIVSATGASVDGTIIPRIADASMADALGNTNSGAKTATESVTFDTSAPVASTFTKKVGQANPDAAAPVEFTLTFNQAINPASLVAGDFSNQGSATVTAWSVADTGDQTIFTISATTVTADGTIIPRLAAAGAADLAGNTNAALKDSTDTITFDTAGPGVTSFVKNTGQNANTNTTNVEFKVTFDQEINAASFTTADLSNAGTATVTSWSIAVDTANTVFIVSATGVSTDGTITPRIADASMADALGNTNSGAKTATESVAFDTVAPVASTFTKKVGQANTVAAAPVDFTLTFNQAINPASLASGDFSNQGSATVTTWSVTDTGDQTIFTISAATVTADGTIIPRLAAASAADVAGNTNAALKDSTDTITYDATGPDVSAFVKNTGQNANTNATNVEFKVTFNQEINPASFTTADLSNTGTATVTSWSIAVDTANTVFTVSATGVSVDGTITPRIADASVADPQTNTNAGAKTASESVTFDTVAPVASTFTKKVGQPDSDTAAPVDFTLTFNQAIDPASLMTGDFSNQGTATVTAWTIADTGDQTIFTISATTVTADGTIIPRLAAAGAADLAGNTNAALKDSTDTITFDATGPDVTSFVKNTGQNANDNTTNVEFKVTFNQEINPASFTTADLSNAGTATVTSWTIAVDTANTIFIVSASGVSADGTITPRIADASVADGLGNTNSGAKTATESVGFDTSAPVASTFTKKIGQANSDAAAPVEFTLTFDQTINPASLVAGDFSNQGSATVTAWTVADTGDQTIFTISATTVTADGTIIPRLAAAGAADLAGNTNAALKDSTDSITFDTVGPDVTSYVKNTSQNASTNTTNVEFKVTFDQEINPASFTIGDLSNIGTATVTSWSIAVDTANTIFIVSATGVSVDGTITPRIANASVADVLGNTNLGAKVASESVTFDTVAPVASTFIKKVGQANTVAAAPVDFTLTFNQAINPASLTAADFSNQGSATVTAWAIADTGDQTIFTVSATTITTDGTIIPRLAAAGVIDSAGNSNAALKDSTDTITFDATGPDVIMFVKNVGQNANTNATDVEFKVTFNQEINPASFTTADLTNAGTATVTSWTIALDTANTVFIVSATGVSVDGTITPRIADGSVADAQANTNAGAKTASESVTFDTVAPVASTFTKKVGQSDSDTTAPVDFTLTFNQAINPASLAAGDFSNQGSATVTAWSVTDTGDQTIFTISATTVTADGTIIPRLAVAGAADLAGNTNTALKDSTDAITFDATGPDVTSFVKNTGQNANDNTTNVEFKVTFNQEINPASFTTADLSNSGTATVTSWSIAVDTANTIFVVSATGVSADGTITPRIADATVADGLGNTNAGAKTATESVTFDTAAPVASTFTKKVGQANSDAAAPVEFTLTFDQAINPASLAAGDFSNQGSATVTAWSVADTGDQTIFTISATTVTADGTIIPRLAATGAADLAGNTNAALKDSTDTITFDTAGPGVTSFVKNTGQNANTNTTNVEFKVTFDQEINAASFTTADLSNAGTATVTSWSIAVDTANTVFIVSATGVSADGTITPRIADASMADALGNTNSGAKTATESVAFDTVAPVASTFTKKVGQANTVAAAPVEFTLTFNQAINPASLAAGDFSNQGSATVTAWSVADTGDQTIFTISATTVTADGTIIPRLLVAGAADLAGNTNAALKDSTDTITFDATGPDVTTFVKNTGQNANDNTTNVEFKVTFNQEINPASFTAADLSNAGTATVTGWSIAVDTANTIFIVSATGVSADGTITPRIADASVADGLGNTNAGAKTATESVAFDTSAPVASTFTKKVGQANSDAAAPVEFTLTFDQAINPASLTGGDFSNQGSATVTAWSVADTGDQTIFTISATTMTADGTIIPRLAAAAAADLAGNTNAALKDSTDTITFDATGPDVTSFVKNTGQNANVNTTNVEFKVTFNQEINPASFTAADLSNAGTATVTSWSIAVDTANTIFVVSATGVSADGTITPRIADASVADGLGNTNSGAKTATESVAFDTSAPVASTFTKKVGQANSDAAAPVEFTLTFNQAINPASLAAGDFSNQGSASVTAWSVADTGDQTIFTISATTVTADGTIIPRLAAAGAADLAGNTNVALKDSADTITFDATGPDVTSFVKNFGQNANTNATNVEFKVIFNQEINPASFTVGDLTNTGTALVTGWSISVDTANTIFIVSATTVTLDGTIIPRIADGSVADALANANAGAKTASETVSFDTAAPVASTFTKKVGQSDSDTTAPVDFTLTFNQAIDPASLLTGDFSNQGTATVTAWTIADTGDQTIFTISATTVTADGTIIPRLAAAGAADLAGNTNAALKDSTDTITFDATGPDVTSFVKNTGQNANDNTTNVEFKVTFNQEINPASFTTADLSNAGTATVTSWSIAVDTANTIFVVSATGVSADGTITPRIADASVADGLGNTNAGAKTATESVTFDTAAPVASTFTKKVGQANSDAAAPVEFTLTFDQAINPASLAAGDFSNQGSATVTAWTVADTGDQTVFTISATTVTADGTIIPRLAAAGAADLAGNTNAALKDSTDTITFDTAGPGVTSFVKNTGQNANTNTTNVEFKVTFDQEINAASFTTADLSNAGTATVTSWSIAVDTANTVFIVSATGVSTDGTITPRIADASMADVLGNTNSGAMTATESVTFDTSAPVASTFTKKVGQANSDAAAPVEFTLTFSQAINPASLVAGDFSNQGSATVTAWSVADTGDQTIFTISATTVTADGTIIPRLLVAGAADLAGNTNAVLKDSTDTITFDATGPDVTSFVKNTGQNANDNTTNVEFMVTFNQEINPASFTAADLSNAGTATVTSWSIVVDTANTVFIVSATGVSVDGTITPRIADASVADALGNTNSGTKTASESVTFDTSAPVASTFTKKVGQADTDGTAPVDFTLTFNQAINPAALVAGDFTNQGTATVSAWSVTDTGDQTIFTISATTVTVDGTIIPRLAAAGAADLAGNTNASLKDSTDTITFTSGSSATLVLEGPTGTFTGTAGGSDGSYLTWTVRNTGGALATFTSKTIGGTNSSQWTLTDGCSATLAAAATCSLSVKFEPDGTTCTPNCGPATLSVAATGTSDSENLNGTVSAVAKMTVTGDLSFTTSPNVYDYDDIQNAIKSRKSIRLTNTSGAPVTAISAAGCTGVPEYTAAEPFGTNTRCANALPLAAGASCYLTFELDTSGAVTRTCNVDFTGTTPAAAIPNAVPILATFGEGTKYSLDSYGLVFSKEDADGVDDVEAAGLTVTLKRVGTGGAFTTTWSDPTGPFYVVGGTCTGASISNGASCTKIYGFNPTAAQTGLNQAFVTVLEEGSVTFQISLTGYGEGSPAITYDAGTTYDFGYIKATGSGNRAFKTVKVTNSGSKAFAALSAPTPSGTPGTFGTYAIEDNTCPATLGIGAFCYVTISAYASSASANDFSVNTVNLAIHESGSPVAGTLQLKAKYFTEDPFLVVKDSSDVVVCDSFSCPTSGSPYAFGLYPNNTDIRKWYTIYNYGSGTANSLSFDFVAALDHAVAKSTTCNATVIGNNSDDKHFCIETDSTNYTCGTSIAAGSSCKFEIFFNGDDDFGASAYALPQATKNLSMTFAATSFTTMTMHLAGTIQNKATGTLVIDKNTVSHTPYNVAGSKHTGSATHDTVNNRYLYAGSELGGTPSTGAIPVVFAYNEDGSAPTEAWGTSGKYNVDNSPSDTTSTFNSSNLVAADTITGSIYLCMTWCTGTTGCNVNTAQATKVLIRRLDKNGLNPSDVTLFTPSTDSSVSSCQGMAFADEAGTGYLYVHGIQINAAATASTHVIRKYQTGANWGTAQWSDTTSVTAPAMGGGLFNFNKLQLSSAKVFTGFLDNTTGIIRLARFDRTSGAYEDMQTIYDGTGNVTIPWGITTGKIGASEYVWFVQGETAVIQTYAVGNIAARTGTTATCDTVSTTTADGVISANSAVMATTSASGQDSLYIGGFDVAWTNSSTSVGNAGLIQYDLDNSCAPNATKFKNTAYTVGDNYQYVFGSEASNLILGLTKTADNDILGSGFTNLSTTVKPAAQMWLGDPAP